MVHIKRVALRYAYYRAIGICVGILGSVTLTIALIGDKSWDSIAFGIALIAIGLSYEGISSAVISDFKLNVVNEKIDRMNTELETIREVLSIEKRIGKIKAEVAKIDKKTSSDEHTSS